jgi:DNA polymerase bacteriophage-type
MRQIGKVMELMLQYQGGVGAFITGAATYGIDLDKMADAALPTIPADVLQEAEDFYDWTIEQGRTTFGLERRVFVACDSLKRLWRRAHPNIVQMWYDLEFTVRKAIRSPGNLYKVGPLNIRRDGAWLRIRLPSGRFLCYPNPELIISKRKTCKDCEGSNPSCALCGGKGFVGEDKTSIAYMGVNQYSRKWSRIHTYGGKLLENITQAVSRDVMANAMPTIEEAGYEIVLTVHDEIITEAPDSDEFNAEHLSGLLAQQPKWAPGLPLAAGGFEAYRYRKE